jgi:2-C-methyl-D-erythritol 4-phosphate cytidylyltransferase/2-C-methyl-D-erythritol 2,4-cyclodiphosphate synthase
MAHDWGTIIVAGGSGSRFGGAIPKQYAPLAGRPVLAWSLETLADQGPVVIVVDPNHAEYFGPLLKNYPNLKAVAGGATRQQSVMAGLKAFNDNPPRHVLIHDAARPMLPPVCVANLKKTIEGGARSATLAVPVADTLMRGTEVIDRTGVQAIQTPQAFDYELILDAHNTAKDAYTDDTSLVFGERGVVTQFVPGCPDNFKITTQGELAWAEKMLFAEYADTRTGLGFDIHKFGPGTSVRLFGVDIPSPQALIGHSDADAGLHAIADAILGTIGAGDIGLLFPPSDPQWKGMDSALIVEKALTLLRKKGGFLAHADIMLMSEFPRIGPHRDAIVARLSKILNLPADAIGLKATTTEKLGSIGRGEGLAVQAIVTVRIKR